MSRALEAGQVIDGFRLEEELPSGALGRLWRVSRPDIAFSMLMKIPLLRPGENPLTIVGFEVEQMILPRLSGAHVPRFVAAGDFSGPYVVMELIAGKPLEARVPEMPLSYAEVAGIGAKIATALHDIHRQQVVHLDVKPSNLIMDEQGKAVLIDFGLSRHLQLPDLPAEEFDGPIGTGAYISPEQLDGIRHDPRSDLFALGVILYLLATGELPFGEPVTMREWRRRLYHDPLPPRVRRENCPPWLQEIILRCLEISPAARYPSAAQLAFDLQHPDQVALTSRAKRLRESGAVTRARRFLDRTRARAVPAPAATVAKAPIVVAAIDLAPGVEQLAAALRTAVRRVLQTEPGARVACVNVLKLSRIGLDAFEDEQGRNLHLQRLAELKRWSAPLAKDADRITWHVFEAADPASELVEFALRSQADHIVIGARGSSALRRYLGSVSSRVVAEAPCTITVVRTA